RYAGRAGGDPQRLEAIDERLELLRRLARKHGGSLAAALQRREAMKSELESLEHHDEALAAAQARVRELAAQALRLGRSLSEKRRAAAAGFSRAVAAVGRALAAVASGRQVICITHLPQIAVFAERHQVAEKEVRRGRTHSRVAAVEGEARVQELARLLSGRATQVALQHARELLEKARARRASPARKAG